MFKFNKSSGQAARLLLVLAVIVFVAVIIVYLVMRMATPAPKPPLPSASIIPLPVYEAQLGDIRFVFMSAIDRGDTLRAADVKNPLYSSFQKDIHTTARFIQVTIGAQNKGTENTQPQAWEMENIVDSKGRNFVSSTGYDVTPWLPNPDLCGSLLKPAFDPTPCTKIYEVSKESTGLKVRVLTGKDNTSGNLSSGKTDEALIDLILK